MTNIERLSTLDKVAEAIAKSTSPVPWDALSDLGRENATRQCIEHAIAAISAMRNPSNAMEEIGEDILEVGASVKTAWQAMIDTAKGNKQR